MDLQNDGVEKNWGVELVGKGRIREGGAKKAMKGEKQGEVWEGKNKGKPFKPSMQKEENNT